MPVLDLIAWGLLVVWAILLCGGLLFGKSPAQHQLMPTWIWMTSSAVLALLAWYGYLLARLGTDTAGYAIGIAGGITMGLLGDLFLARQPAPIRRSRYAPQTREALMSNRMLVGLSAFALSNLLYIGAIAQYGDGFGGMRWLVLVLWLVFGTLAGRVILFRTRRRDPLWVSVAVGYTLLLCATVGFATGLALTAPLFGVLAAGAVIFLVRDLILVAELFAGWRLPFSGDTVWLLCAPGQALIVASIWSALQDFA